ncbi:hypothetical protein AAKU55_004588 [Oxalobacteraceae bacterium GrIS 1.11]
MSYANPKLAFEDCPSTTIKKLADGSLGAETVLNRLFKETHRIDPTNALGSRSAFYSLDGLGIYGDRIVRLYEETCENSLVGLVASLRAVQLGILRPTQLSNAIEAGSFKHDSIGGIIQQVMEQIPAFNRTPGRTDGLNGVIASLFTELLNRSANKAAASTTPASGAGQESTPSEEEVNDLITAALSGALRKVLPEGVVSHVTVIKVGDPDRDAPAASRDIGDKP